MITNETGCVQIGEVLKLAQPTKPVALFFNKNLKNTAQPVVLTELQDFWTSPIFLNLPLFELFDGYGIVDVTSPFLEPTEPFLGAMETIVLIGAGISQ